MAANGAGGNTLKRFENVLGSGLSVNDLDLDIKSYLSDLMGQKYYNTALNVADSVWIDNHFTPKTGFLQKNADYFGGNVFHTDLSNPSAVGLVDQWAASQSNGLIRNIADHLTGQEAMLLVNAMCFNARWGFGNTHNETFTPTAGKSYATPFMENQECAYLSDGNSQGALVRYMDSRFAFAVILPNTNVNLSAYIRSMDVAKWRTLLCNPIKNCVADIQLPKFTTAFSTDMKTPLAQMGLCDAFNTGKADFSGIASQLYISQVQHSTYMTIDENRTIAGAATLTANSASCVIQRGDIKTISLDFNRPFLYAVVDFNTGIPLFIGTMESPKA